MPAELLSGASRHEPVVGTKAGRLLGCDCRVVQLAADGQKRSKKVAGSAEVKQEPGYMGPLTRSRKAVQQRESATRQPAAHGRLPALGN
ncbi:hypothetical protein ABBQ38_008128 [Trebouxia sp. C0009 RCD-2024]